MEDLHIRFQAGGPRATATTSETPTRTRGERVSLDLQFSPTNGTGFGVDFGNDFGYGDGSGEYERMADRIGFVDPIYTGLSHDGVPWVDERLPSRAPVDSQILLVEPGDDVQDIDPFWAVIVGGDDTSRPPRGLKTMTVEMVFLADGDRYATRDGLVADIGANAL